MTEMQAAPPMSGSNLPQKELEKEKIVPKVKKPSPQLKKRHRLYLIAVLLIVLFFAVGIGLGFYLSQEKQPFSQLMPLVSPSPSPETTVSPSPSSRPTGLEGRLDGFEEKLEKIDLKEEDLLPPFLDSDIRFESKE
jgi:hypothetical protein